MKLNQIGCNQNLLASFNPKAQDLRFFNGILLMHIFLRLVCTNGMVSKTEVSASYRHISLKILEKFPEVLDKVSAELSQQKSQFRISMQTSVENPLMTIESFNRQF